ncbi:MAG TPA: glycosyltransferase family 4 protein [Thermoplasmata archaeon]|nr:glycosyltransferase family 4 protein [Thermoplasmata archaeon]
MLVSNDVVHDTRVLKEARALRDAGHEIAFIGWDRSGRGPAESSWDGIRIRLVRTRGLLRLAAHDALRNPLWWRMAARLALREPFDAVHCHDLDTLPSGVRLKRKTGRPLVYDCHEVFGYMIEEDMPGFVVAAAFRLERRLAPQADRVIAVNEAVKRYIDGVTGRDSVLVQNCQELLVTGYRPPTAAAFTVLYVGTLHKSRFILPAIDVVGSMPDVRLVIGGTKALAAEVAARCAQHPNTTYLGPVPNERVLPLTLDAHAVLSMFDPALRINQVGFPNKIFEAMAAGRPAIVTEGLPMSDLVLRESCGLAVPYTTTGFRSAIERLRGDPSLADRLGRNGLEAARRTYNWQAESQKLVALYEGLGA